MNRVYYFSDGEVHGFSLSLFTLTYIAKPLSGLQIFRQIAISLHHITAAGLKPSSRNLT